MEHSEKMSKLVLATQLRKSIVIQYKEEEKTRLINPHAVYTNHKGNLMLDAWQISGETNTQVESFKCFLVEEIARITLQTDTFEIDSLYKSDSDRYKESIAKC